MGELEGGEHEGQVSGLEGARAEEKVQSAQTPHAHEGVGEWPVGAVEGRRGTAFGLPSLSPSFTLALALAALRPHCRLHTLHADLRCLLLTLPTPAAHVLPLLSALSPAFPLPHPGVLYRSAGSFRGTGGARPSGLWDAAASRLGPCSVPRGSHPTASHRSCRSPLAGSTFQDDARFRSAHLQDGPASRSLPRVSGSAHAHATALATRCPHGLWLLSTPREDLPHSQWFSWPGTRTGMTGGGSGREKPAREWLHTRVSGNEGTRV